MDILYTYYGHIIDILYTYYRQSCMYGFDFFEGGFPLHVEDVIAVLAAAEDVH